MDQLTEEDILMMKETRQEIMAGRMRPIEISYKSYSGSDEFTDLPVESGSAAVTVSGVVGTIKDDDILLAMEGKLNAGDTRVSFYYDDIFGALDLDALSDENTRVRAPADGEEYLIGAVHKAGIGTVNRIVLGLMRSR